MIAWCSFSSVKLQCAVLDSAKFPVLTWEELIFLVWHCFAILGTVPQDVSLDKKKSLMPALKKIEEMDSSYKLTMLWLLFLFSSCTQYREAQKSRWLTKCIEELKTNSMWVLPALKQIREICCLYQEAPHNTAPSTHHTQRQGMYFWPFKLNLTHMQGWSSQNISRSTFFITIFTSLK